MNLPTSLDVRRPLKALLLLLSLTFAAGAQEPDSTNEVWPEFDFFIKLNEKSRIYALFAGTKPEQLDGYADGQSGIHVDYYAVPLRRRIIQYADSSRSKVIMLRGGYLLTRPKNDSGTATEHMASGEGTARAHLWGDLQISNRHRMDFRWTDGNPKHRYRNRLKLEKTFAVGRFQLTPYAHAELFYDFQPRAWTRLRYAAGAEWNVTKRIILEGFFLRQNTWASVPQFVNATGLAVQFYFR